MLTRYDGLVVADDDGEGGQVGGAGEDVAAGEIVLLGAVDLLVVGGDNGVVDEDEGGAGVFGVGC